MSHDKRVTTRKDELPSVLKQITADYVRSLQETVHTPLSDKKLNHVKNVIKSFMPDE